MASPEPLTDREGTLSLYEMCLLKAMDLLPAESKPSDLIENLPPNVKSDIFDRFLKVNTTMQTRIESLESAAESVPIVDREFLQGINPNEAFCTYREDGVLPTEVWEQMAQKLGDTWKETCSHNPNSNPIYIWAHDECFVETDGDDPSGMRFKLCAQCLGLPGDERGTAADSPGVVHSGVECNRTVKHYRLEQIISPYLLRLRLRSSLPPCFQTDKDGMGWQEYRISGPSSSRFWIAFGFSEEPKSMLYLEIAGIRALLDLAVIILNILFVDLEDEENQGALAARAIPLLDAINPRIASSDED